MKILHKYIVPVIFLFLLSCGSDDDDNSGIDFLGHTWNSVNAGVFSHTQNGGVLELQLTQNAVWLDASRGGLFYTLIDGDFDLMATVRTTKKEDNSAPPDSDYSFGGLMVRDPNTGQENYVHLVTGTGNTAIAGPYGYEYKVTTNSASDYQILYDGNWEYDLRISRSGNNFTFYVKPAGSGDQVVWNQILTAPLEMSSRAQVGFSIYSGSTGALADMKVTFSDIRIE